MTNNKPLRRALLTSALAILVCVSMLVGTTFAWFTDNASASVNTIQAGTLDVALEVSYDGGETWQDAQGKSLEFVKADGAKEETVLWEPGCTYSLPLLRVVNKGNLALKYKVLITGIQGDAKLNEVIEWNIQLDGQSYAMNDTHVLTSKNEAHTFTITGHMDEAADNTYQGLTIENISITIYATQYTAESDSTDSDYDEEAPLPEFVTDQQELNQVLSTHVTGELVITMPSNASLTLDSGIVNNNNVTFLGDGTQTIDVVTNAVTAEGGELNYQRGSSFTFSNVTVKAGEGSFDGIVCDALTYVDCTIQGKLTLYCDASFTNCVFENDMEDQYSLWTWGADAITVKNCVFNTNGKAILLYGDGETSLTVTNSTFIDSTNGATGKAAIETGNDYNVAKTLVASNNTIVGFAINTAGTNTGTKVYGDKNSMVAAGLLTVTLSGNQEDVSADLILKTAADLVAFEQSVNDDGNTYAGKTVLLAADIDMSDVDWTPIGQTGATQFLGTFDGNGHTISNLTVDTSDETDVNTSSGLFGWLQGTVKNLSVDSASITGAHNVGVIAGCIESGSISGCTVSNSTVLCVHKNDDLCGDKAGGIVGIICSDRASVVNCTVVKTTITAGRDAGQVIGCSIIGEQSGNTATNVTVTAGDGCTGANIANDIVGRTA